MGMYDTITCRAPYPADAPPELKPGTSFQTKSIECMLLEIDLTAEGVMVLKSADDCPLDLFERFETRLAEFDGSVDLNYGAYESADGVRMYAFLRAHFFDGKLVRLKYVGSRPQCPAVAPSL